MEGSRIFFHEIQVFYLDFSCLKQTFRIFLEFSKLFFYFLCFYLSFFFYLIFCAKEIPLFILFFSFSLFFTFPWQPGPPTTFPFSTAGPFSYSFLFPHRPASLFPLSPSFRPSLAQPAFSFSFSFSPFHLTDERARPSSSSPSWVQLGLEPSHDADVMNGPCFMLFDVAVFINMVYMRICVVMSGRIMVRWILMP